MTDDMMSEFIAEASDHLTRAEEILLVFSRQPDQVDAEAINACFRSLHTIKGCSGFLDLQRIQHLSHAGEQVLDALRTNELRGSLAVFDALIQTVGRLQAHIAHLNGHAGSVPDSDEDCVHLLERVRCPTAATAATAATSPMACHVPIHWYRRRLGLWSDNDSHPPRQMEQSEVSSHSALLIAGVDMASAGEDLHDDTATHPVRR